MTELSNEQKQKLRNLAIAEFQNMIYGTWSSAEAVNAFLPLKGLTPEQIEQNNKEGVVHFFAPLGSAVDYSSKGYPLFIHMDKITQVEWTYLQEQKSKLQELIKQFSTEEKEVEVKDAA